MIEVKILESNDQVVEASLRGVDLTYANAIRRFCISEVPCMAIDDVAILENSSPLYDELIAHRLGLIPLKTDLDRYVLPEECDCKSALGCSRCRVLFVLDAEAKDKSRSVYSGELVSEDKEVIPISDKIPVLKLAPNQRVKLEAYAKLGRGRDHAKWQPTTVSVVKQRDNRPDEYIIHIESAGGLPAPKILLKSIEILTSKLDGYGKEFGKIGKD